MKTSTATGMDDQDKRTVPVTIRLSPREHAELVRQAGGQANRSAFARDILLEGLGITDTAKRAAARRPNRSSRTTGKQQGSRTMSTQPEISDEQIRALRDEAGSAGDLDMVSVCDRALDGGEQARRRCAHVIAYRQMRAEEDG